MQAKIPKEEKEMKMLKLHWWRILVSLLGVVLWWLLMALMVADFENKDLAKTVWFTFCMLGGIGIGWLSAFWMCEAEEKEK